MQRNRCIELRFGGAHFHRDGDDLHDLGRARPAEGDGLKSEAEDGDGGERCDGGGGEVTSA